MVGRIILIILLLLILLIFFVPYGVDAAYEEGAPSLRIKAGPFRYTLWPKKPLTEKQLAAKQKKKEKKEKSEAKKKDSKAKKTDKPAGKPKGTDETITVREKRRWDLDMILDLVGIGLRAIRRLFGSFSVDFFRLRYTVVGGDPYNIALRYGRLCAAIGELPALCGDVIRVKRSDIALDCDFTDAKLVLDARIVLSLQLYKIVVLAVAVLAEYLVWNRKTRRKEKAAVSQEREDDNGRQPDQ